MLFYNKDVNILHARSMVDAIPPFFGDSASPLSGINNTKTTPSKIFNHSSVRELDFDIGIHYNTQKAAIATLPLTTHPQWAEPHTFTSLEQIHAPITLLWPCRTCHYWRSQYHQRCET